MTSNSAQILIIATESEDREKLSDRLKGEFPEAVYVSTDEAISAWSTLCPAVTVFACHSLSESESVYLGLLKSDSPATDHSNHQTLVLCKVDEAEAAYQRCCNHVFDDYAVFKPLHDAWQIQISLRRAQAMYRALAALDSMRGSPLASSSQPPSPSTPPGRPADAGRAPAGDRDAGGGQGAVTTPLPEPEAANSGPSVLVVEDDPFTQEVYADILKSNGYVVEIIGDGNEVMDAIERRLPDVILMDINLPTVNGVDATRQLRADARTKATPVIVVTGHRERSTVEACITAGASAYIVKPIEQEKLLSKLRSVAPAAPAA